MKRSKQIIILSHCILNQNTVIPDEARAQGAIPSTISWVMEQGYGVVQLPCPEFTFLGLHRPSMTYDQYNTEDYREHCREILFPIVQQLKDYRNAGYELIGSIGIGGSPSCDPTHGIYMEEFRHLLEIHNISLKEWWYVPDVEEPIFHPDTHRIHS